MNKKQLDFLAIGDITTDAFIRLKDAEVHCKIKSEECELCVRFGDKIPYESVTVVRAVGNSPNAAVATSRLGLTSGLVANLGNDENGKECHAVLKREKVATDLLTIHKGKETNYHYVLWYGADRTILVKHQAYEYSLPNFSAPKWLYLSSLGGGTETYHEKIAEYLQKNPEVRFAFQPGTFQIALGAEKLSALYRRTEVFVCNVEEAKKILESVIPPLQKEVAHSDETEDLNPSPSRTRVLPLGKGEVKILLQKMQALGPKIVIITDGPKGAYGLDETGAWFQPIYPDPKPPLERTGAGDATASTFVAMLILGKSPREALRYALANAMSVVQEIGAQKGLLTLPALQKLLAEAPQNYSPQSLQG